MVLSKPCIVAPYNFQTMKNFRIFCLVATLGIIVFHFTQIDYEDLRFRTNKFHYLGIVAMALVAGSFLIGVLKDRRKG
jgi:hypothetical protein